MKNFATVLRMAFAATAFASARIEVPMLPSGEYADTEVATNVALNESAARLERLTLSVAFEPSETNEVLAALGVEKIKLAADASSVATNELDLVWYSALNPNNVFGEIVADTKRLGGDNAYEIDIGV